METASCRLNLAAKTYVLFVGVFRNYRRTWGRSGTWRGTARGDSNDEEEEEKVTSLLGTIVSVCVGGGAQQGDTYIILPSPNTDARPPLTKSWCSLEILREPELKQRRSDDP
ncbi:hypothetical protein E2C01_051457 [Portunus trituberculatus]|uniref:Uncharacterized protein n=1 Tax=Portunus trituberculatus TaxID=210409 RepID=A0A5B7GJK8_PORTR|nr:hypothetical protein [Portunus trituberculatus]